jgi:DNA polymerase/3'-5' exonuclease PolX
MSLPKMPLEFMQEAAEHLVALLEPDKTCKRMVIAGSIRRKKPFPGDVEIVLEPLFGGQSSMFGGMANPVNRFDEHCEKLLRTGALEKRLDVKGHPRWGERTKLALFFYQSQPVKADIFSVLKPAEWGTILAIRTGPGEFNKLLVQHAHTVGRKVADGQVWDLSGLEEGLRWKLAALPSDKFVKETMRLGLAVIPTPTEEAYFAALKAPCWPPEDRTEDRLGQHIRK